MVFWQSPVKLSLRPWLDDYVGLAWSRMHQFDIGLGLFCFPFRKKNVGLNFRTDLMNRLHLRTVSGRTGDELAVNWCAYGHHVQKWWPYEQLEWGCIRRFWPLGDHSYVRACGRKRSESVHFSSSFSAYQRMASVLLCTVRVGHFRLQTDTDSCRTQISSSKYSTTSVQELGL
jgi:hypothetical protein